MFFYYMGHTPAFYPTKSQFFRSFVPQKAGCLVVESDLSVLNKSDLPQHTYHTKFNQPKPLLSLAGATFAFQNSGCLGSSKRPTKQVSSRRSIERTVAMPLKRKDLFP